jgi:hypothetical protein
MVQPATELVDYFMRHLSVHRPVPSMGMQLEDTSVPSAYVFLLQLPCLRILGTGRGRYQLGAQTCPRFDLKTHLGSNLLAKGQG